MTSNSPSRFVLLAETRAPSAAQFDDEPDPICIRNQVVRVFICARCLPTQLSPRSSSFRPLRHPEEKLARLCAVIHMPQFPNVLAAPPLHLAILALKKIGNPAARTRPYSGRPGTSRTAEDGTQRTSRSRGLRKRVSDGRIAPCCRNSAESRSRVDGIPLLSILRCSCTARAGEAPLDRSPRYLVVQTSFHAVQASFQASCLAPPPNVVAKPSRAAVGTRRPTRA